jgi:hypothetical protein
MAMATSRYGVLRKLNYLQNLSVLAFLPFTKTTYNHISQMLSRHIKMVRIFPSKVSSFLWLVKDG